MSPHGHKKHECARVRNFHWCKWNFRHLRAGFSPEYSVCDNSFIPLTMNWCRRKALNVTQRALKAEMGIQEVAHKVSCFFKDAPAFHVYAQHGGPCSLQSPVRAIIISPSATIVDVWGPVLRLLNSSIHAQSTQTSSKRKNIIQKRTREAADTRKAKRPGKPQLPRLYQMIIGKEVPSLPLSIFLQNCILN